MAVSDDEEESVLQSVTNYHFVDDREEPVSFSILPIQLGDGESKDTSKTQVFLHGTADSGLQKIFKQVLAWRLEFSEDQPEILVFSKDKNWIKLLKPRKSFEETIRTSLITIHSLHFLKKNPGASKKSLWDHLNKIFSSYEVPPSEYDLLDQQPIIRTMVDADEALAKSELLLTFLERPKKRKPSEQEFLMGNDAKLSKFIVDDDEDVEDNGGDESEEESDLFDSVCAICDNGGEILCCEGKCLRSFHATRAAGSESNCKSLGLSQAQVDAIQNFLCRNCKNKQHQCFACGKLGSSDKSANPEVFPCVSATCGHFYHPECVSKLLHAGDEAEIEEHRKKIVAGEAFTCPVHKCLVCKQGENKEVKELQFAVCRRCPRSYHRKCLPRKISFEDSDDGEIIVRAWDNLIPNRILIYCPKHKIDEDLGTPIRNHILFPAIQEKKLVHRDLASSGTQVLTKKRKVVPENTSKETDLKSPRMGIKSSSTGKSERVGDFSKKPKTLMDLNKYSKNSSGKSNIYKAAQSPEPEENRASMKEEMPTNVGYIKGFETTKSKLNQSPHSKAEKTSSLISSTKRSSASLIIDDKTRDKIRTIMKKPLITLSGMMKNQKLPSTHMYYSRNVDKTITHGKVEGSVEAVRTALNKLEEGASIEDAKAVCEPEIINQIIKWKNKLNVYLAPFLHGMRYTSYGRHFTKVDKLKEIVEKLHWYVQSGDMIVDFCCGANDFSRLMKEKLDETGKRCSFKNFDLIQPKNDFNFEKKDWMQVKRDELPTGSQLIMGLNPPFGVRASLANKFIDKALEFKPKLLILIVPGETERLDKKKAAYDLIWEDSSKLSGKSFYLPGSVDVNDKQMEQWNAKPPLLYLWSRPDWTTKHRAVALQRGHLSVVQRSLQSEDDLHKTENWTQKEDISDCYKNLSKICDLPEQSDDLAEELEEKATCVVAEQTGDSPSKFDTQIDQSEHTEDAQTGIEERETSKKRSQEKLKEKERKGGKKSSDKSKRPDVKKDVIERAPSMIATPVGGLNPASPSDGVGIPDTPRDRTASEESPVRFHSGQTGSGSNLGSGYVGASRSGPAPGYLDDITRRYSLDSEFGASYRKHSSSASLGLDYGSRATEIGVNNSDFISQRTYMDDMSEHSRSEQDIRMPPRVYGHRDEFDQRRRYILGQESSLGNVGPHSTPFSLQAQSPLGRLDSIPLQRYMPHLDEGNYRHVPRPLPPGSHIANSMARMGPRPDSLDFVQGPLYPFPPHRGSSGWLND